MSETIAITGKSVKLFKGHYTSACKRQLSAARLRASTQGWAYRRRRASVSSNI
ncbi:MAG: hypothetical protein ACREYE_17345 [Gammaproteobacteria bacterium]